MDEVVEKIVAHAISAISKFSESDQYFILEEVCERLTMEGALALRKEYLLEDTEDE